MTRVFLLVTFLLLITIKALGQCANRPTVTLSSTSGSTCSLTPKIVAGNTFGGSATKVTITENGAGSVTPGSTTFSPFTFTYTPKSGDLGKNVIITVTTNNPLGLPCAAAIATYTLTVSSNPSAPLIGTITQPTCLLATGSVALNGLPSTGTWTLTRSPGGITNTGTGTSTTISGLSTGTYTYRVTNSSGCISSASSNVVISSQPVSPANPVQTIDCSLGSGNAVVRVTSPTGTGLTYSLDGGTYQSGTSFSSVADGNHLITVRNSSGCSTTGVSFQVSCECANPPTVTLSSRRGSTCGTTSVTVSGNTFGGSATNVTITEDGAGTVSPASSDTQPFEFTYTPAAGDAGNNVIITITTNNPLALPCIAASGIFTLTVNVKPSVPLVGAITQPTCLVATGSVGLNGLPATDSWTLTRTPDGVSITGTGTSTIISGLAAGTYNFTVTNAAGCTSGASAGVEIKPQPSVPSAPVIGTILQPTCSVSTGSAVLSGLPSTGTWTLIRSPGDVITTGSGASTTISNLTEGIYTFSVTNSVGCSSPLSGNTTIKAQPAIPDAPIVGHITPPTCTFSTGSVVLNGLPPTGTWTLTRYPGSFKTSGTGTSITISGLSEGLYNYTLTSSDVCVSGVSADVIIPNQPVTPSPPLIGTITQPTGQLSTGSVVLNGLPESGSWTLTLTPGNLVTTGVGITNAVSGLVSGTYSFTVTNAAGCTSGSSASFGIFGSTGPPTIVITDPAPVCFPSTVDITAQRITAGSSLNLTFTYWTDAAGSIPYNTASAATAGTYYIKGTTTDGLFSIKPVTVTVYTIPLAYAGTDKILAYQFETSMNAELSHDYETGLWSVISGTGEFFDVTSVNTSVIGLSISKNLFLWTVTNGICPASSDTVIIDVHDFLVPTLITPNMDGKNDFLIFRGSDTMERMELVIFDRRGVQVYRNRSYDNSWNGVDANGNPIADDTYFYVLKTEKGKSINGYIVIRR